MRSSAVGNPDHQIILELFFVLHIRVSDRAVKKNSARDPYQGVNVDFNLFQNSVSTV